MKYSIVGVIIAAAMCWHGTVLAHSPSHYHPHHSSRHRHDPNHWIVPALIGGAVIYAVTRPPTVVVAPPPAPVAQDIMILDGIAYRRQIMIIDGQSREVWIRN